MADRIEGEPVPALEHGEDYFWPVSPVQQVKNALANPEYDFFTPAGIAESTGLDETVVRNVIDTNPDMVRKPLEPVVDGYNLYTLRERRPDWRERYRMVVRYLGHRPLIPPRK